MPPDAASAAAVDDAMAAAAWPVCTICYEDLRPLSDQHLHCLPACGHVFHALCLEQWLEYCPGGKKKLTCPICKQPCGAACPPTRLFFQSTGACPSRPAPPRGKERMVAPTRMSSRRRSLGWSRRPRPSAGYSRSSATGSRSSTPRLLGGGSR